MKKLMILFFAFLVTTTSSFASYYGCSYKISTVYHFTKKAYGKTVQSVIAHTGVLATTSRSGGKDNFYWQSVQDIPLELSSPDGDFTGFAGLFASKGGGDGSYTKALYPVVEYHVTFDDGSTLITEIYPILKEAVGTRVVETMILGGQACY